LEKSMSTQSSSTDQHRSLADGRSGRCAILTISDTRTLDTDKGGLLIQQHLEAANHIVVSRALVPDEPDAIAMQLDDWLHPSNNPPELILTTGGTGIARRDTTVEIVERVLDKKLDGFGELFRMLSWEAVGPAAMLSRAVAGLANETLIFTLPGSTNAIELAMSRLIIPELPHLLWERTR